MTVRPEVLPEEYAAGYQGRVMRLNGMANPFTAMRALMEWVGRAGTSRMEFATVELLAKVADLGVAQFVQAHTVLPLRRAVVPELPQAEHGCSSQRSVLWSMALRHARPGAYLCTHCVREDIDFHGMSYWRREHQLPGHYACTKHREPLGYVDARNAFLCPPSTFRDSHQVVDSRWVSKLERSGPVQRYLAITADLLARSMPLDERVVSRAARDRATQLGLHTGRGVVERRLVSDLIKDQFDAAWIASVVPGLAEKSVGQFLYSVDGAVLGKRQGLASTVYAIVFAALFDSPDEAINAMLSPSPHDGAKGPGCTASLKITNQQLLDAYIECNGSYAAVGRKLGLGRGAVRRRSLGMGLPYLGSAASSPLRNAAEAVLVEGVSIEKASKKHGVDRADLERLLIQSAGAFRAALIGMRRSERGVTVPHRPKPMPPPRQRRLPNQGPLTPAAGVTVD